MKEYKYKEVKRTIKGIKHDAIIPEEHSTIQALVYEVIDLNWGDDWANITDWHTLFMVLKKGGRKWITLFDGKSREFQFNGSGIYGLLFQLETKEIRDVVNRKEEMKAIRKRMRIDAKRLKELGVK